MVWKGNGLPIRNASLYAVIIEGTASVTMASAAEPWSDHTDTSCLRRLTRVHEVPDPGNGESRTIRWLKAGSYG